MKENIPYIYLKGGGEIKMSKCVYCGKEYFIPRGVSIVKNDGTVDYLCSSKCRKNMLMKRRKVRWISKNKK